MVDLSIVVVSYNCIDMLRRCLRAVEAASRGIRLVITVVDNASADGSPTMIGREFPHVEVARNDVNRGFAAAANQGLRHVRARYYLLLNPDVTVAPTCLARMLEFMDRHPACGGATCRTFFDDFGGWQVPNADRVTPGWCLLRTTRYLPRFPVASSVLRRHSLEAWRLWLATSPREIPAITGAFFLVRAEVLESVGPLDEAYFMYFEDSDWSRRIRRAGWSLWYNPAAAVVHSLGGSSQGHEEELLRATLDSEQRFLRSHHGMLAAEIVRALRRMDQSLGRILAGGNVGPGRCARQPEKAGGPCINQDGDRLSWTQVPGASGYVCELATTSSFTARIGRYVRSPVARIPVAALRDHEVRMVYWRWVPVSEAKSAPIQVGHGTSRPWSVTFGRPRTGGSTIISCDDRPARPALGHP
jgi:GT2 family glycosyltransferase